MPSLQKARLKSVRVVDLSNCRQFASYCILYADNNDSNVPVGYRGWGNDDLAWFNSSVKDLTLKMSLQNIRKDCEILFVMKSRYFRLLYFK